MFLIKMVQAFERAQLDYVMVGGYAVNLHGAVRGTVDIDIVVRLDQKSFSKTEAVLKSLGLESQLPVGAAQIFKFREEYISNRNLIAWKFVNPKLPSECVDIIITENLSDLRRVKIEYKKILLKVISVDDLIKMKSKAGRPQDQADVKALEKVQRR